MNQVLYSLGGKYFHHYGVHIAQADGLAGLPKPKARSSYDWAEHHGHAIAQRRPYFDEREISLTGWVVADSWDAMVRNFHALMQELQKNHLARLVIEFDNQALVYDVYLAGALDLKKNFRKGQAVGTFTLTLKEPQPIKKTIRLVGSQLSLSFHTEKWATVNIDGIYTEHRGQVDIRQTLAPRTITDHKGRNLVLNSIINVKSKSYGVNETNKTLSESYQLGETYTATIWGTLGSDRQFFGLFNFGSDVSYGSFSKVSEGKYQLTFKITQASQELDQFRILQFPNSGTSESYIDRVKVEKGNQATDWTPAPEETHYITIEDNDIANLQTNAQILW